MLYDQKANLGQLEYGYELEVSYNLEYMYVEELCENEISTFYKNTCNLHNTMLNVGVSSELKIICYKNVK